MREIQQLSESEIDWSRLAPVLDRVMHELAEADRLALLLRYFEKRPFVEVGSSVRAERKRRSYAGGSRP